MKKTLVALAALAVVGAASAQSTVTLYGKIDLGVASRTEKTAGVKTANNVGMEVNSGQQNGSRWGLKGSEDLGGGLKANFQLESSISADSGASTGFTRQAWGGLSGGFGAVTLGRQYSPYDNNLSNYDPHGATASSAFGYVFYAGGTNGAAPGKTFAGAKDANGFHGDGLSAGGRINNSIIYATPAMGGFMAEVMYAPGEDKATGVSADSHFAVRGNYTAGPLQVGLGYEQLKINTAATAAGFTSSVATGALVITPVAAVAAGSSKVDAWALGVQYDFGVAKVYGMYEAAKASGTGALVANGKDSGWGVGASIPVGSATVGLSYAREKNDPVAVATDGKVNAFGAQLIYPLSKRTRLYTATIHGKSTTAAGVQTKTTVVNAGFQHDF